MATYAAETSASFDLGKAIITEIGIIWEHSVLKMRGFLNKAHVCSSYRLFYGLWKLQSEEQG